jgi:hypothetical protein
VRFRDLIYLARRELRDAVVELYARPLRERVAQLEEDNHQLHLAVALDVTTANVVVNAARAVVRCGDGVTGPCNDCLELLRTTVGALDGRVVPTSHVTPASTVTVNSGPEPSCLPDGFITETGLKK